MSKFSRLFGLIWVAVGFSVVVNAFEMFNQPSPFSRGSSGFLLPLIVGVLFIYSGGKFFLTGKRNDTNHAKIKKSGQRVVAEVIKVERGTSHLTDKELPWTITAELPLGDEEIRRFYDTVGYERPPVDVGSSVVVGIDHNDPSNYAFLLDESVDTVRRGLRSESAEPQRYVPPQDRDQPRQRSGSAWGEKTGRDRGAFYSN